MKYPTIHLNGTSKNALIEQYSQACMAIQRAIRAMCEASPHGRDYYPQGPDTYRQANDEHLARIKKLEDVGNELQQIIENIGVSRGVYND